jgi:hypothetical protein
MSTLCFQTLLKKIPGCKNFVLPALFVLFTSVSFAQSAGKGAKIEKDSVLKEIRVEFNADKEIATVLVLITDSTGKTLFLDNHSRFKGPYKHHFDMAPFGAGNYFVQVIKDEEHVNKKLILH